MKEAALPRVREDEPPDDNFVRAELLQCGGDCRRAFLSRLGEEGTKGFLSDGVERLGTICP